MIFRHKDCLKVNRNSMNNFTYGWNDNEKIVKQKVLENNKIW
mgnify:CR=1 FL=1